jgi:hypothetical protein
MTKMLGITKKCVQCAEPLCSVMVSITKLQYKNAKGQNTQFSKEAFQSDGDGQNQAQKNRHAPQPVAKIYQAQTQVATRHAGLTSHA